MQKSNTSLTVSPTEQMYALNRITEINRPTGVINATNAWTYGGLGGVNGMGAGVVDLIVAAGSKAVGLIKSIGGLFTKDPNRDIHIPAQNAAVQGFQQVLGALDAKMMQGTLTQNDIANGAAQILAINAQFGALCDSLSQKYPNDKSRYQAGKNDVNTLAQQIASGQNLYAKYAGHYTASSAISSAINSVTQLFTGGAPGSGSSIMPLVAAAGLFFIVPKLIRSK